MTFNVGISYFIVIKINLPFVVASSLGAAVVLSLDDSVVESPELVVDDSESPSWSAISFNLNEVEYFKVEQRKA